MKIISALQNNSSKNTSSTNVVPEFDPDNKSQDVQRWLKKVNECSVIYGWDEKQTIHYALQKLCGLAKRWYEALPSLDFSWEEWQAKLTKAFPNDVNYGKILEEMLNRKSRTDETLRDYFYDKLTLLSRCEIVGRKAVDCIIYGLADSAIRNGAQALKCEEPEDLLNYLASQQPSQLKDLRGNAAVGFTKRRDFRSSSNNQSRTSTSGRNTDIVCFNCNERGHTFHTCSKPLTKCVKCGRVGHNSNDCNRKPLQSYEVGSQNNQQAEKRVMRVMSRGSTESPIIYNISEQDSLLSEHKKKHSTDKFSSEAPREIPKDNNEKFHKIACVNGTMLSVYIDFGSECSLIRCSDAKNLGLAECNNNLPTIKGFGNSTVIPKFQSHVQIKIDEIETDLIVLAVDDNYLTTPMLIGQNFTELNSVTVMKNNERLIFYHTPSGVSDGGNATLDLFVAKDVDINKGGLVEVYSKEPYTGDVYMDGSTRTSPNQEYYLHQGCYTLKENKAVVFVSALTDTTVKFKANKLIARVNPVTEAKTLLVQTDDQSSELQPLDRSDIKVNETVDQAVQEKLYQLLQKYRNCFANNLSELGCAKNTFMDIDLHDKTPVVYRPYRLSHPERQKVRNMVEDLIQNDIVQESNSNYASPILLVKKKNGELRLCVDYRALNSKTVKDKYPLPLIDDQLSNLSGNKFFITLDLASGYYQIPMGDQSRHLTAFVTPDGHYEFKRMPFGLANAPSVFQRLMNGLLGSRRFSSALAYMDDLLIPSATIEEGFERLEDVLKVIQEAGLTLKLSKCIFFATTLEYLGYEISSEGIKPSERKISAVRDFPAPRNVHEVRQFLGLASYFRRFVKGFGEIARPLTALLKKDAQWRWDSDEEKSFKCLKNQLIQRPLLALYNPDLETEVHTDASSLGLGGILMQWQTCPKLLKPVAYFSRQTTPEERYFHSYELETLAVVCSLKKFRPYLLGLNFCVYTDCNALRTTLTKRDLIPRIARWWLLISEYNFTIEYRPGCRMSHVDALSRNPPNENTSVQNVKTISTENWILTLQMADPELERIIKILKPNQDAEVIEIKRNYSVKNHSLYRKVGEELRLVIPKDARWQICKANHDEVGHFGFSKTLERVQSKYWFPKMRRFIKKYVAACIDCAYNKDNGPQGHTGLLHPIPKVEVPFDTLHMDHLGPFVRSKSRNSYILTIVDGFTKYLFARPVRDTKTRTVIKVLQNLFHDFGVPRRIISDRGTAFTSGQFKEFCAKKGIKHVLNAVACPRANGQAERFNRTILTALSAQNFGKDERIWDEQLGKVQWGINNTINASTKKTASEVMFGVKLNCPIDNILTTENVEGSSSEPFSPITTIPELGDNESDGNPSTSSNNTLGFSNNTPEVQTSPTPNLTSTNIEEIRHEVSDNIKRSQERQKEAYDANKSPATSYSVGDLVKITKTNFNNDGKSKKLLPKFIGPFKVTKSLGNDRYQICNVPGFNTKKYDSVVASDRMRPWINIQALEINGSSRSSSDSSDSE